MVTNNRFLSLIVMKTCYLAFSGVRQISPFQRIISLPFYTLPTT